MLFNTDIDECADNNGACSPDANCTNTPGSFTCTCIEGYSGDGINCSGNISSMYVSTLSYLLNYKNISCSPSAVDDSIEIGNSRRHNRMNYHANCLQGLARTIIACNRARNLKDMIITI